MALRPIRTDSVGFSPGEPITEELTQPAAILLDPTIDRRRRRQRNAAVAVGCVTVTEVGCPIDALQRDVFLLLLLAIEGTKIFDGPEVGRFVIVGCAVFDVVQSRLDFAGGDYGRPLLCRGALKPPGTVAGSVFLATVLLDLVFVKLFDNSFEDCRFDILLGNKLREGGHR